MLDITQLQTVTVTVIGDLILDTFYHGKVTRFTPDAPVPVIKVQKITRRLGGAANVANNLASLGVTTNVVGLIGKDDNGKYLKELLTKQRIGQNLVEIDAPTITKMNVIGENIDGESQKMFRMDFEETTHGPTLFQLLLKSLNELVRLSHALILSDYGKGVCTPELCQAVIQLGRTRKIPVVIDPKGRDWRKYAGATIVKPNVKELGEVLGTAIKNRDEAIVEAGREIMETYQLKYLLVSRSAKGLTFLSQDEAIHLSSSAREIVDVIGAGDALVATFTACLAAGFPVRTALEWANCAAGVVCGKKGTEAIIPADLLYGQADDEQRKVIDPRNLAALIEKLRTEKKSIIFTNGCFDLLHKGHIEHLRQAKALGDILIIGLNSDDSIRRIKGGNRPINRLEDRIAILQQFTCVDYIIRFDEDTPTELIKTILPDILVKGGNNAPHEVPGREFAKEVRILPFLEGYSTTNLIQSLQHKL